MRDTAVNHDRTTSDSAPRAPSLAQLAERMRAIERRGFETAAAARRREAGEEGSPPPLLQTGWDAVDTVLSDNVSDADGDTHGGGGGLLRGCLHEFIAKPETGESRPKRQRERGWEREGAWAPLGALAHLARRAVEGDGEAAAGGIVVWIGRRCWPTLWALSLAERGDRTAEDARRLLRASALIDARDVAERLWAMDAALRCAGVAAVVGDGSGLDLAGTRRLQLAAESGGVVGLLARPPSERWELSAATTRWLVGWSAPAHEERARRANERVRWSVELLRCKGVQPSREAPRTFAVEWDRAEGAVCVSSDVVDRSEAPPLAATPWRRSA